MYEQSQPALLKLNLHCIKFPHQVSAKNFNRPLYEQPVVYKQPPINTSNKPNIFLVLEELIVTKTENGNKEVKVNEPSTHTDSPSNSESDSDSIDSYCRPVTCLRVSSDLPLDRDFAMYSNTETIHSVAQFTEDMVALGAGGTDWLIDHYSSGCDHHNDSAQN